MKMRKGWKKVKVHEVAKVMGGATPSTSEPEYWDGGVPWLTPKDLSLNPARYTSSGVRSLSAAGLASCSAVLLPKGSILISSRAPIGFVSIANVQIATNQGFKSLILKDEQDSLFWYYLMLASKEYLERFANGSTFKEISAATLGALEFTIPPIDEQIEIARVLGSLDDLIIANQQLTEKLKGLRVTLVSSIIRESTNSMRLSELATFVNGKNFTKDASGHGRPVIRTPEIRRGPSSGTVWSEISSTDEYLARSGDILFVWSGSLMVERWLYQEGLVNQHIFKVVPNFEIPAWLVMGLLDHQMPWFLGLAMDKATTMGHIQRGHLDALVPVPSKTEIAKLDSIVKPLWDSELQLLLENQQLKRTRDELLSLLLSGEIIVKCVAA